MAHNFDRLWAMEVFVRVAECGSFSRAAESLNLANATVTICIRNLERHLDTTLLSRDTRRLRLTEEGELYLQRAREVLQTISRTEDDVRSQAGALRGRLHVEMPISLGHALLCPALPAFARDYPDIVTSVTLTNQPHNMIERAIDVAIRIDGVEDAELVARPIYETEYVICATPAIAANLPEHPAELDPRLCLGLLAHEGRYANPWQLSRNDEQLSIQPAGPVQFNSSDAVVIGAESGIGLSCVLDVFCNRLIESGKLQRLYPDWTLPVRTFYAVTGKERANSAKVRAFTDFLYGVLDSTRRPRRSRPVAVKALRAR
jgi:LysR family transcriptional regulator for bpeEF and oprC